MFECVVCNQQSEEIYLGEKRRWFGLIAVKNVVYLRDMDSPCDSCGDGPGHKVMLNQDRFVAPVEWLLSRLE